MAACLDILGEFQEASIKRRLMDGNSPECRLSPCRLSSFEVLVVCKILVSRVLDGNRPDASLEDDIV